MDTCILVIDDEPGVLALLHDVLEAEGFQVTATDKPGVALGLARDVWPHLFLIDVMLPGTSGIELAEQLRTQGFADTPMIAMSASKIMRRLAAQSGAFQGAIDKPFDIPTLLECVERCAA